MPHRAIASRIEIRLAVIASFYGVMSRDAAMMLRRIFAIHIRYGPTDDIEGNAGNTVHVDAGWHLERRIFSC